MRTMTLIAVAVLMTGCGEDAPVPLCEPGALQACPCIGGGQGIAVIVEAE